jgi:hypothetical protein
VTKKTLTVAFILLGCLTALELGGFMFLTLKEKGFYPASYTLRYLHASFAGDNCSWGDKVTIDPYLAVRYHHEAPCAHPLANPQGLLGASLPRQKDTDHYNVLLLGGSVAELLHLSGSFEQELNARYLSPTGRPFKVWNLSVSSGQQPRQAIAHFLHGHSADLVVSLEGYNEHVAFKSGVPLDQPPKFWQHLESNLTRFRRKSRLPSLIAAEIRGSAARLEQSWLRHSYFLASLHLVGYELAQKEIDSWSLSPQDTPDESAKAQAQFFQTYRQYLSSMDIHAQARQQQVMVFLQMVPALHKPLTEAELRRAGDLSYAEAYAQMVNELTQWSGKNLRVVSLLDTFKDYSQDLYIDMIHFLPQSEGNVLLGRQMAQELARAYQWKEVSLKPRDNTL